MKKIAHVRELTELAGLPVEVINVIREAVTIFDAEYGEARDVDSENGGYVLDIEKEGELRNLKVLNIDVEAVIPEYVDVIACNDGQIFTSTLLLIGSDFAVLLVMPLALLPESLQKYITQ